MNKICNLYDAQFLTSSISLFMGKELNPSEFSPETGQSNWRKLKFQYQRAENRDKHGGASRRRKNNEDQASLEVVYYENRTMCRRS